MLTTLYTLQSPGEWVISKTALVVDAKALYDSIRAEVSQLSGDKRTKIEVMIVKEKMQECQTLLRWVSSEAQYADGQTLSTSVPHWPPSNPHVQIASR